MVEAFEQPHRMPEIALDITTDAGIADLTHAESARFEVRAVDADCAALVFNDCDILAAGAKRLCRGEDCRRFAASQKTRKCNAAHRSSLLSLPQRSLPPIV